MMSVIVYYCILVRYFNRTSPLMDHTWLRKDDTVYVQKVQQQNNKNSLFRRDLSLHRKTAYQDQTPHYVASDQSTLFANKIFHQRQNRPTPLKRQKDSSNI